MRALAWQHLRRQPWRFAAAAGSIASSALLVLTVVGLYLGLVEAIVTWPRTLPGDLVVGQAGTSAMMLHSSSQLAADVVRTVQAVPGVAAVHPLYGRLVWLERDPRQAIVFLVGVGKKDRFGLPARVLAGHGRPAPNEIIVDQVLAHDLGVGLGETVTIGGATLHVGGVAAGGNAVLGSYAFVHRGALALAGFGEPSHLFVTAAPGTTVAALAERLSAVPGVTVLTRAAFEARNQALARQLLLPLIAIMAAVTTVVSGSIVALTLWTATVERRADYGLLAAIGIPARQVEAVVLWQSAIAAAAGVTGGVLTSRLLATVIPLFEPRFETVMPGWLVAAVTAGAFATALLAALVPVRAVARVDPGVVFRV